MPKLVRWLTVLAATGLIAGVVEAMPAQAATAPVKVTTGTASSVSGTTETLVGTIDNGGSKIDYQFQYGSSTKYGTGTPVKALAAKKGAQTIKATITHLKPNHLYHYRLVAITGAGSSVKRVYGADMTFTSGGTGFLTLRAGTLTVVRGSVKTPLTCDSTLACTGKFSIGTKTRDLKTKKVITAVCVAGARFAIKAHKSMTVNAKVLPGCLALLKDNKRVTAKITSSPRSNQHALVQTITVVYKS